jgi:hypothetical protein
MNKCITKEQQNMMLEFQKFATEVDFLPKINMVREMTCITRSLNFQSFQTFDVNAINGLIKELSADPEFHMGDPLVIEGNLPWPIYTGLLDKKSIVSNLRVARNNYLMRLNHSAQQIDASLVIPDFDYSGSMRSQCSSYVRGFGPIKLIGCQRDSKFRFRNFFLVLESQYDAGQTIIYATHIEKSKLKQASRFPRRCYFSRIYCSGFGKTLYWSDFKSQRKVQIFY